MLFLQEMELYDTANFCFPEEQAWTLFLPYYGEIYSNSIYLSENHDHLVYKKCGGFKQSLRECIA